MDGQVLAARRERERVKEVESMEVQVRAAADAAGGADGAVHRLAGEPADPAGAHDRHGADLLYVYNM